MFENLTNQPPDKIIALMGLFAKDQRETKLDLGVGVYKNNNGQTTVMKAVKEAETELLNNQVSKSYVGLLGSTKFVDKMVNLTLGELSSDKRVVGAQAPGGTGALHQLFLLVRAAKPTATVWLPIPTWPNHTAILTHLNIKTAHYRYFDESSCSVDFEGMIENIKCAKSEDILLLHGCCHNPTGANLSYAHWNELSKICCEKGITPLIDLAYQGFGDGLLSDTTGVRKMASLVPDMMIATSCSKNFGLYRDRVGAAIVLTSSKNNSRLVEDNLKSLNRLTFSFPPDHGASVVEIILSDSALKKVWMTELEEMRQRMLSLRENLTVALKKETNSDRFNFVKDHRGMFSRLGLTENNVERLRNDFGIYMVSDSRINLAGLQPEKIDIFARAIASII